MNGEDFLRRLTDALEEAGVGYMLAGSMASSFHGEPRSTRDLDLVVDITAEGVRRLKAALPDADYYFDIDAALSAVRRESQFNVIDMVSGWKADLIRRKSRPFSQGEFERRQQVQLADAVVWMVTPEDVILSKLEWAKKSSSERQLRDVRGVLDQCRDTLDFAYLRRWVTELQLEVVWDALGERWPPHFEPRR